MTPFDRLYVKHYRTVRSTVGSVLAGAEDREDAQQNAWLQAHRALGGGAIITRAWLVQVALNEARDIRREARIRKAEELPDADGLADATACRMVHSGGKLDRIQSAITALPDELRVILQSSLAGVTQAAIAARLGVSQQAVARKITKAQKIVAELVVKG